jgi:hypothetical protein
MSSPWDISVTCLQTDYVTEVSFRRCSDFPPSYVWIRQVFLVPHPHNSHGVHQLEREADQSPALSAEVKND